MTKLKVRAGTKRKCLCGCGKLVHLFHHKFIRGHNMRLVSKNELKYRLKAGTKKKYGVDNIMQVPEVKKRSVVTRRKKYTHWMGNLTEEQLNEFKMKCSRGGKTGGATTAKQWKAAPEKFKAFLEAGHQKQMENGHYEKIKGSGNPMSDPKIKLKHKQAVKAAMAREEVKEKMRAAAPHRSLFTPRKEKHYRWKGGVSFKRGYDWKDIRKFILTRDSHKCVICESTKHLHVHHIVPVSSGIDIHFLNDPFNLVTMCNRCHMRHEPTNCYEKEIVAYLNNWGSFLNGGDCNHDEDDEWS